MTKTYFVDDNNTFKEIKLENKMIVKRVGEKVGHIINSLHSCTYNNGMTNLFCRGYHRIERRLK